MYIKCHIRPLIGIITVIILHKILSCQGFMKVIEISQILGYVKDSKFLKAKVV